MRTQSLALAFALSCIGCTQRSATKPTVGPSTIGATAKPQVSPAPRVAEDLSSTLEKAVADSGVPGLAAAVVDVSGVRAIGAAGVRRAGSPARLQPSDLFHLGSDTKAMTAFMLARLAERGVLGWDMTLAEAFPELEPEMHADYRDVPLIAVLHHRAGFPANAGLGLGLAAQVQPNLAASRRMLASTTLREQPEIPPGEGFLYSNLGYIIAGAIAENKTGTTWETLMQEEVFEPLEMSSCGFGPPSNEQHPKQPWGHAHMGDEYVASRRDNPPWFGPAGTLHCSLEDWGKFARASLRAFPQPRLLSEASWERLQAAPDHGDGNRYAAGWIVAEVPFAQGQILAHDGSNTLNYASILLVPQSGMAVLVACNAGGEKAPQVVAEMIRTLAQRFVSQ